jgi:hypothetical protein
VGENCCVLLAEKWENLAGFPYGGYSGLLFCPLSLVASLVMYNFDFVIVNHIQTKIYRNEVLR